MHVLTSTVAWLNILAYANQQTPNELVGIKELLQKHYAVYGRSFFSRYDYEEAAPAPARPTREEAREAENKLLEAKYKIFRETIEIQKRWRKEIEEASK